MALQWLWGLPLRVRILIDAAHGPETDTYPVPVLPASVLRKLMGSLTAPKGTSATQDLSPVWACGPGLVFPEC